MNNIVDKLTICRVKIEGSFSENALRCTPLKTKLHTAYVKVISIEELEPTNPMLRKLGL